MESIAYGTDFNSKKPLLYDTTIKISDAQSSEVSGTKLNLIRDAQYDKLDGILGPFAAFTEYSATSVSLDAASAYSDGKPKVMSMDFSSYTDVSQLNNVGISVRGVDESGSSSTYKYVLTNDTSLQYRNSPRRVNTGSSVSDAINNLVQAINNNRGGNSYTGRK